MHLIDSIALITAVSLALFISIFLLGIGYRDLQFKEFKKHIACSDLPIDYFEDKPVEQFTHSICEKYKNDSVQR